jgi:hypothetical protein
MRGGRLAISVSLGAAAKAGGGAQYSIGRQGWQARD